MCFALKILCSWLLVKKLYAVNDKRAHKISCHFTVIAVLNKQEMQEFNISKYLLPHGCVGGMIALHTTTSTTT